MFQIFISYRRIDTLYEVEGIAAFIREWFGPGYDFIDKDRLQAGEHYPQALMDRIESSKIVLAVIGPDWTGQRDDGSYRILDHTDWIRIEMEKACDLFPRVRLIPVYVRGAEPIDQTSLPPELSEIDALKTLSGINGVVIRELSSNDSGVIDLHDKLRELWNAASANDAGPWKNVVYEDFINSLSEEAFLEFNKTNSDGSLVYSVKASDYDGFFVVKPPISDGGTMTMGFNPNTGLDSPRQSLFWRLQQILQKEWKVEDFKDPPKQFSFRY